MARLCFLPSYCLLLSWVVAYLSTVTKTPPEYLMDAFWISAELLLCTGFSHAAFCPEVLVILLSEHVAQALKLRVIPRHCLHSWFGSFLRTDTVQACDPLTWNPSPVSVKVQTCGSPGSFSYFSGTMCLIPRCPISWTSLFHICCTFCYSGRKVNLTSCNFPFIENVNFS